MSDPTDDYATVLERVRAWPVSLQRALAQELLRSHPPADEGRAARGVPAALVRGLAVGEGPPPDEDTLARWIEDHRAEKYG